MTDVSFNLNSLLTDNDSPLVREKQRKDQTNGIKYLPKVDIRRVKTSSLSIRDLVQISNAGSAIGTLGSGESVSATTTLTPDNTFSDAKVIGIPYAAIYVGTSAIGSNQLYPNYGSGIDVTQWDLHSGFDYNDFNATTEKFTINVANISAGAQSIFFVGNWKYIVERGGTASIQ